MDTEKAIKTLRMLMALGKEAILSEELINPGKGNAMAEVAIDKQDLEAMGVAIKAMKDMNVIIHTLMGHWTSEDDCE